MTALVDGGRTLFQLANMYTQIIHRKINYKQSNQIIGGLCVLIGSVVG